jgi:hypothetical protein
MDDLPAAVRFTGTLGACSAVRLRRSAAEMPSALDPVQSSLPPAIAGECPVHRTLESEIGISPRPGKTAARP